MPTQPPPPARPAPPQPPQQRPAMPGATVAAAQTYPPGSRYNAQTERTGTGPDPQEAKLRPYELAAEADEPVRTIAQEQRERSEAMQEEGVERFKAKGDDRDPNERPRSVPGVGFRPAAGEGERSTPPARAAQNKASP